MLDDRQLLARYSAEGSEAAFGEIVSRHVNLVYSTALRRTGGNAYLAQDVAQSVFTDLARKAGSLPRNVVLSGWLHRATRFAAGHQMRTERRRRQREQEAAAMNALESEPAPDWEQIHPLLDAALDRLNAGDRDALLLRFFEQRSLAEVGRALGANEEAARKRVSRALQKLRARLVRRGVSTTVTALATVLTVNAVQVAPAGLALTFTSASLAGVAAGTGTTFTLLNFMAATKLKFGLTAVALASVATTLVIQHQGQATLREQDGSSRRIAGELTSLRAENDRLTQALAEKNRSASNNNPDDLARLRTEAAALREQAGTVATLQQENQRLRATQTGLRTPLEKKEDLRAEAVARMRYSHRWAAAILEYAGKHNDQVPKSLDEAAPYFRYDPVEDGIVLSPDQFELVYQGSLLTAMTNDEIIVIRQKQPWQTPDGKRVKVYGFADGHSQLTAEPPEGFEAYERKHMLPPTDP